MSATTPEPASRLTARPNIDTPACLIALVTSSDVTVSTSRQGGSYPPAIPALRSFLPGRQQAARHPRDHGHGHRDGSQGRVPGLPGDDSAPRGGAEDGPAGAPRAETNAVLGGFGRLLPPWRALDPSGPSCSFSKTGKAGWGRRRLGWAAGLGAGLRVRGGGPPVVRVGQWRNYLV